MTAPVDLAAIKATLASLAPLPWTVATEIDGYRQGRATVVKAGDRRVLTVGQTRPHHDATAEANVAFAAAAPDTVLALIAEVERLRAVITRVKALADGAFVQHDSAPMNGTLAVVDKAGGSQDMPPTTRVFARVDDSGEPGAGRYDPYFPGSGDWFEQSPDTDNRPWTWSELNWLDDPPCDRGSVQIDTYVSVEALGAALAGPADVKADTP